MPIINEFDAQTQSNVETEITQSELDILIPASVTPKTIVEIVEENTALKDAALAKLTALGLTEEEAKAIIG